jgi:hypothetical protein
MDMLEENIERLLNDIKRGNGFAIKSDLAEILKLDPQYEWWNIHTKDGKHILEFALESNSHSSVIAYFLEQKPKIDLKISESPLLYFCVEKKMSIQVLDLVLKAGADLTEKNQNGETIFDVVDRVFPLGSHMRLGVIELLKHSDQYGKMLKAYIQDHKDELKSCERVASLVENSEPLSYYGLLEKFLGEEESQKIAELSINSIFLSANSTHHVMNPIDQELDRRQRYEDGLEKCSFRKFSTFFDIFEEMAHIKEGEYRYSGLAPHNCDFFD